MKTKMRWGLRDENNNPVYITFEATKTQLNKINKWDIHKAFGVFHVSLLRSEDGERNILME